MSRIKSILLSIFPQIFLSFAFVSPAFADPPTGGVVATYPQCGFGGDIVQCIVSLNRDITALIMGFAVILALFMLPYIGLLFASGDPAKIEKAKEMLTSWAAGFILVALSGVLILIVLRELLGVY